MKQLLTDIQGIIQELNLSVTDVLYPFYETVVNSIQAVSETGVPLSKGKIRVTIERDITQQSLFEQYSAYPISCVTIEDNGIGFNKSNIDSFSKAHSTKKLSLGGKGLGRFAVLSVFKNISVESVFEDKGTFKKITFTLSTEGMSEPVYSETKLHNKKTIITLNGLQDRFIKESAKYSHENIADNILGHCLLYFLSGNVPTIVIEENGLDINLTNQFSPKDFVRFTIPDKIKEVDFTWYFVKKIKGKGHELCLCAHNRKVKSKKVEKILPIFASPIQENRNGEIIETYFTIYVISDYLDKIVNSTRNAFNFPKEKENDDNILDLQIEKLILEKDIDCSTTLQISNIFRRDLEFRAEETRQKVEAFRASDEGLEFRHLELEQDFFNALPSNANSKKISDALYELDYQHSLKRREKRDKLFKRDYSNQSDYQELMQEVIQLESDEGMSRLAQYIFHRKTIITLLERYLEWCDENNNYEQESTLHNLIYTMGGNQSTISYDKHNLWLIDDRLSFHRYIYSDTKIKKQLPSNASDSIKEPDIAIYDIPFAYGEANEFDEISSVVIFELKRPDRVVSYDDFSKQMRDQVKGIRKGHIKNYKGQNITTGKSTPIFFYFICDTNTYSEMAEDAGMEGFRETPYKSLMRMTEDNVYQEILTYKTLLSNAKRRNAIFFKKLGI